MTPLYPPDGWLAFGDAAGRYLFLNWAFQATLLLAAGLMLSLLPRLRPSVRHGLLVASLLLAAAGPALGWLPRVSLAPASPAVVEASAVAPVSGVEKGTLSRATSTRSTAACPCGLLAETGMWASQAPIGWLLLLVWSGFTIARLMALAHGTWCLARWRRFARPADRDRLYAACRCDVADLPVLESAAVTVPCVVGILRPCILLPQGMAAALEAPALRHVLLHEEAHARRRDPLCFFAAELCAALLFWHPLAALARRRMESAAEDACDAYVLGRGIDGASYARTLLTVLENAAPRRAGLAPCPLGGLGAPGGSQLRRRVTRILSRMPHASRPMALLAGGALVAAAAGASTEIGVRPRVPISAPEMAARPTRPVRRAAAPRVLIRRPLVSPRSAWEAAVAPAAPAAAVPEGPASHSASAVVPATPLPDAAPVDVERGGARLAAARTMTPRAGRCVVFVLDTSTSMRVYQAATRRQILGMAERLGPDDRFNVLAFASDVRAFAEMPVAPGEDSLAAVRAWMDALPEGHGTNLSAGLGRALETPDVTQVVLISDGVASQGITNPVQLVSQVEQENRAHARLVAISPGPANRSEGEALLATLTTLTGGDVRTISQEPSADGEH
jgi:beta-lactamase regulating signal transducer with metallopeptidase domain/Mg-chelatase subunit ChlD